MVRLGWGIAGCGWVARDFVAPAILGAPNSQLVALLDHRPEAMLSMPRQECVHATSIDDFLATPELGAVYVATPNNAHRLLVEAAAQHGFPVLCEKPMATTYRDAVAMVDVCSASEVTYATAFDQRFHPAHQHLARLIAQGAAGIVTAIRIVYACWVDDRWAVDNWRTDPARAGGGALIDLAPHGLDLATILLGEALTDVHAFGQSRVHPYPVEDAAMLTARSASGTLVQLHVAYNCPEMLPRRRLEVTGTAGLFTATDTMGQTPGGTLAFTSASDGSTRMIDVPGNDRSPFLQQIECFSACILSRRPFPFTAEHDLHIMKLVERAQSMIQPALAEVS